MTCSQPTDHVRLQDVQDAEEKYPHRYDEDIPIRYVKLAVLGDTGVGKSAILERFMRSSFPAEHMRTNRKVEYSPSLILDNSIFELKVVDIPVISFFPANSEEEWENYRFFGLRSAHAYLLVFDISSRESFKFISTIRDQLMTSRDLSNVPVVVVANKSDLLQNPTQDQNRLRHDVMVQVKKNWKLSYVEASAKYNYNISYIFKILAQELKSVAERRQEEENGRHQRNNCFHCIS